VTKKKTGSNWTRDFNIKTIAFVLLEKYDDYVPIVVLSVVMN
jgi:hypothetical protein